MKTDIYNAMDWLHVLWRYSSVIIVPAYVHLMKKMKIIIIKRNLVSYITSIWMIYYGSLLLSDHYIVPKLNQTIYGLHGYLMGFKGLLEEFLVQLLILVPLYIVSVKIFPVSFKSKIWNIIFFLFYYFINYALWTTYINSFRGI